MTGPPAKLIPMMRLGLTLQGSACGVQDEFTLAATAQNLRKLAKLKPMETAAS